MSGRCDYCGRVFGVNGLVKRFVLDGFVEVIVAPSSTKQSKTLSCGLMVQDFVANVEAETFSEKECNSARSLSLGRTARTLAKNSKTCTSPRILVMSTQKLRIIMAMCNMSLHYHTCRRTS